MSLTDNDLCTLALTVIETESQAIQQLQQRIGADFAKACRLLLSCKGRVIVIGMGKSGHIGGKIAATLASTGTPAFFIHPAEASHGDMGMVVQEDVVLALSYSGNTQEVLTLLPLLKRLKVPLIALTGNVHSELAQQADVHLDVSVDHEACPLGLAPTSSTTVSLVMGDCLAVALLKARGFTEEAFAFSHPGGRLGRRLLLTVSDIMHSGAAIPKVTIGTTLRDALLEVTAKKLGMTTVLDERNQLVGIFTDGDLRRALDHKSDIQQTTVEQVMTKTGKTVREDHLVFDALTLMEQHKITTLVVINGEQQPIGIVHMHDVVASGVV